LKLTTRARYALQSMIAIARMSEGSNPVSLARVAERTRVSRRYLEQLALSLKNASLLRAVSGRGGGYVLARPPKRIRVGEIVEAAIGPINIVECVLNPETCLQWEYCECRLLYELINRRITEALNEFNLHDLVDKGWNRRIGRELAQYSIGTSGAQTRRKGKTPADASCGDGRGELPLKRKGGSGANRRLVVS